MEICYSKKRRKRDNKDYDLNVFKITFACLLLFLALCVEISCQNVKYKALKETLDLESTQTVSKSISDVIDEFYIKNYIGFDFIIYGNTTNHINDVINKLKTIPATIMQIPDIKKWDHKLNRSAIFFVKSLDEFSFIHEVFITFSMHVPQTINIEPKKFKLLIYVEGTDSFESVESKTRLFPYKYYGSISKLLFFEFIIFNDRNKIILVANVLFSEKLCGHIHLKKLNSFDKITLKWDKTLENFDQYANLHGCMINFDSGLGNDFYVKSFENLSIPNGNLYDSNFKFAGVTYILLEILAAKHNLRIHHALRYDKNYQVRAIDYDLSSLYSFSFIKNTFQNPLFEQTPYFQDSQTLYTYDYYFLISYNDFYTNYEKLTFPFDTKTWILIFLTFSLTFTSIFGLHFCPRWFKEIVFGRGVIHPAYNALGIFFGISQIRLPRESFCRAIFIIYLWYCLIIRTCWQSKMFECITNDMRKPLPESIEDLIDMNYKVKIKQGFKEKYEEILNGKNGPQIDVIEYDELKSLYKTALNGKIKTKYAFLLNTEIHAEFNSTFNDSLPIMKNERLTKPCTFTMMRYNIMTQPVDNIISKLMPSGILQHQSYYDIWYLYRPVEVEVKDSRRVLSMSDLEFGFVIFLGVLSLSIIVFICELHVLHVRRQLRKLLDPTQSISKSISDVIDEFYIKNNIDFDLIIYGNTTNHINDVINGLKNQSNQETFPTTIKNIQNVNKWNHRLNKSAIFFVNSLDDLKILHEKSSYISMTDTSQFTNFEPRNFKFLVYIEEAESFELVENTIKQIEHEAIGISSDLSFYELLMFYYKNEITLAANVFYSEKKCSEIHLKKLNRFDTESQKWVKKLENFDHYTNFHSCMLNFIVQYHITFYIKDKEFSKTNEILSKSNLEFGGVVNTLLEAFAAKLNFTAHYKLVEELKEQYTIWPTRNYNVSDEYVFYFLMDSYDDSIISYSQPLYTYDFYFLVSYNDLYTNYEKLTFPFDTTSWILIFFTFALTFTTIFGLHFCPRWFKEIIFGRGINDPAYNALGIFFGIAQLRLPRESFCRTIFIIYLWYCLIIRTCWQSKMFEFVTSDMRKPLPESIEDLRDMDYEVLYLYERDFLNQFFERLDGLKMKKVHESEFSLKYEAALNGETKTKYAFFIEEVNHAYFNLTYEKSLPIMKNERLTKECAITMLRFNIINHPIEDIIKELIPSGILQYDKDYGMWYHYRPIEVEVKESRKVLSMSDLEFGFVIFLGFLGLSIVVFICELHALYLKRQLRNLLGLFEFVRVIRERLKDYHDRW